MRRFFVIMAALPFLAACGNEEKKSNDQEQAVQIIKPEDAPRTVDTASPAFDLESYPAPASDAYSKQTIKIGSFEELYRNIGSNRTLEITAAEIKIPASFKGDNLNVEIKFGMTISGVSNLKIIGLNKKKVRIIQPDPASLVLSFYKCENVIVENIEGGHFPEKGSCAATVINLDHSKGVFIEDCILFGSGYEGVTTYECDNVNLHKTTIHGCSTSILSLSVSRDIRFFDCSFTRNKEPNGAGSAHFIKAERVVFNDCKFIDNAAYMEKQGVQVLFDMQESKQVYVKGGMVRNNKAAALTNSAKEFHTIDVTIENNTWQKDA